MTCSHGRPVAVFLDRDGVLSEPLVLDGRAGSPRALEDFHITADAYDACTSLRSAGYLLLVVTNQPDIARGLLDPVSLAAMHDSLMQSLPIDEIYVCPHDDHDLCECRKPKCGMLLRAEQQYRLCLDHSVIVGDRWSDVAAGRAAGVMTVYLDRSYNLEIRPANEDMTVQSLGEACEWILTRQSKELELRARVNQR